MQLAKHYSRQPTGKERGSVHQVQRDEHHGDASESEYECFPQHVNLPDAHINPVVNPVVQRSTQQGESDGYQGHRHYEGTDSQGKPEEQVEHAGPGQPVGQMTFEPTPRPDEQALSGAKARISDLSLF